MRSATTTYRYSAASRAGAVSRGTVRAASRDEARTALATRGLYTIGLHELGPHARTSTRLSLADLALALRLLADLFDAGLPIAPALLTFEDLAPPAWKSALPDIAQSVREGTSLATALSTSSLDIPPLVVGMLHAGEAGGGLVPALRRAAAWSEKAAEARASLHAALAYPAFVAVSGIGAVTVLVSVVLPNFARMLSDLGETLPRSTRLLLTLSTATRATIVPLTLGCLMAVIGLQRWLRRTPNKARWHDYLNRLPALGKWRRSVATARMAQSLGSLLSSGVPIAAALPLAARATGDLALEQRLFDARELIVGGMTLARALELKSAATPTAVRLIRAGEETGRLAELLEHAAHIEGQRVERSIRVATRLLEPTLLLGFALVVGFIAAALLQAIYSVRPGS